MNRKRPLQNTETSGHGLDAGSASANSRYPPSMRIQLACADRATCAITLSKLQQDETGGTLRCWLCVAARWSIQQGLLKQVDIVEEFKRMTLSLFWPCTRSGKIVSKTWNNGEREAKDSTGNGSDVPAGETACTPYTQKDGMLERKACTQSNGLLQKQPSKLVKPIAAKALILGRIRSKPNFSKSQSKLPISRK